MSNISPNATGLSGTTNFTDSNSTTAAIPNAKLPTDNGIKQKLIPLLIQLIQQLLVQLQGKEGGKEQPQPPLKEIQFDAADYERPAVPVYDSRTGQYYKEVNYPEQHSYFAMTEDGFGNGLIGEAPLLPDGSGFANYDIRPHINGVAVVKIEYLETMARYTLENGQVVTGLKPAIPRQSE